MPRTTWDKPAILKKLKQLHATGKDMSYTRLARSQQPLISAAAYHFGSYRKAVERAGIDYTLVSRRPRWSKPIIIKLVKDAHRRGDDLNWSAVTQRRDELGKAAFASLQPRLFGSWDRALHAAGLDADDISRYRKWDRDTIIFSIRSRHRENEALNSGATQQEDPGLHAAAVRHFGTYDEALRQSRLDPTSVRRRRRWDKSTVERELKSFKKQHKEITDRALRESAPALYGAALRLFKTIAAARKAARL